MAYTDRIAQRTNPYYRPGERDAAIAALEARNENLQRQVTRLLDDRRRPCPACGVPRVAVRR